MQLDEVEYSTPHTIANAFLSYFQIAIYTTGCNTKAFFALDVNFLTQAQRVRVWEHVVCEKSEVLQRVVYKAFYNFESISRHFVIILSAKMS
jgi:hypothetical protein